MVTKLSREKLQIGNNKKMFYLWIASSSIFLLPKTHSVETYRNACLFHATGLKDKSNPDAWLTYENDET